MYVNKYIFVFVGGGVQFSELIYAPQTTPGTETTKGRPFNEGFPFPPPPPLSYYVFFFFFNFINATFSVTLDRVRGAPDDKFRANF